MIAVRPALNDDIPALTELWYEKWALLSQSDPRIQLALDARARWSSAVSTWLTDPDRCVLVVEDAHPVGYAVGMVDALLPPGLIPERVGVILDIALDAHGSHAGAARALVDGLRTWFAARDVDQLVVRTPRRQPVEQAFWRALGAADWMDVLWLKRS